MIHAALAGHGVALGRMELVMPMVKEGRLALVGGREQQTSDFAYWLIRRKGRLSAEAETLATWIEAQARDNVNA